MKKLTKWHSDERADIGDMADATADLHLQDAIRRGRTILIPAGRNVGEANTESRILSGFGIDLVNDASIGGNGFCRLGQGSGVFALTRAGETNLGLVLGDCGELFQILDFGAMGDDDYAVYVRAAYQDASQENRVFWDPGTASEYVDYVATREHLTWEYEIRSWTAPAPVGDWVKVWKVPVAAATIGVIVDHRHFFFEGDAANAYAAEWGAGDDRDPDRATYGVGDLHKFVQAVRQKISDIQGAGKEWWEAPDPDLTDLAIEHNATGGHHFARIDTARFSGGPGHPDISAAWLGGCVMDARSGPMAEVLPEGHQGGAVDWKGNVPYVFESMGRIAAGGRLYDDFTKYGRVWLSEATTPAEYLASVVNTGDVLCETGIDATSGAVQLTGTAGDEAELLGPNSAFALDTGTGLWRFYTRIKLKSADLTSNIVRIGLYHAAWNLRFELNNTSFGDIRWWVASSEFAAQTTTFNAADDRWVVMLLAQASATAVAYAIYEEHAPAFGEYGEIAVPSMAANAANVSPWWRFEVEPGGPASSLIIDEYDLFNSVSRGFGGTVYP